MKKIVIIIVTIGICLTVVSSVLAHNEPITTTQKIGTVTYTNHHGNVSILCDDGHVYKLVNEHSLQAGDYIGILFDDKHTETVEDDEIIDVRML